MFKIPSIKLPSLPNLALPKITIPKFSLPTIKLPSLPKIQVPKITVPKITIPKFSVPQIKAPPISKVALPVVAAGLGIPAAVGAGITLLQNQSASTKIELPKLPDVSKPAGDFLTSIVKLPGTIGNTFAIDIPSYVGESVGLISKPAGEAIRAIPKEAGKVVASIPKAVDEFVSGKSIAGVELAKTNPSQTKQGANIIDDMINVRDSAYESGITKVVLGTDNATRASGVVETALPAAADVLLPLDAMNVGNKILTGRLDEVTGEDWFWAAVDVGFIVAGVFSGGLAYGAGRALKTGLKGGKVMSIGKIGSVLSSLKGGKYGKVASQEEILARYAAKQQQATARAAAKQQAAAIRLQKMETKYAYKSQKQLLKTQAKESKLLASSPKIQTPYYKGSLFDSAGKTSKLADASEGAAKVGGTSSGFGKLIGGITGGAIGGWMLSGLLGGTPEAYPEPYIPGEEELPYDPYSDLYDPYAGYDESLWDGLLPEESYLNEDGYYEAGYPTFEPLEYAAQDVCGTLGNIPVAGSFFDEMAQRGLALPAILIGGAVIIGGGYLFLKKTKTGRNLLKKTKSVTGGKKKGAAA